MAVKENYVPSFSDKEEGDKAGNRNVASNMPQVTQTLIYGDCLREMAKLPDRSIDMVLCDLPYGTTARNKWDNVIPLDALWEQYRRIVKDDGVFALWSQMPSGPLSGSTWTRSISRYLPLKKRMRKTKNDLISAVFPFAEALPVMIAELPAMRLADKLE